MTYGGDFYGGSEYAGMRSQNTGPIVTIVKKAVNAVIMTTKNITAILYRKVEGVLLRTTRDKPAELTSKSDSVTLSNKNDNIIL